MTPRPADPGERGPDAERGAAPTPEAPDTPETPETPLDAEVTDGAEASDGVEIAEASDEVETAEASDGAETADGSDDPEADDDTETAEDSTRHAEEPVKASEDGHDTHPATTGHGEPASDACSVLFDHDGTSAFGSAARARFFVVVEQPGPWGRDAARESHLDRELGGRTAQAGGRFMLVRKPGGHPASNAPRTVLVAHAGARPGDAWLLRASVRSIGDLLGLDWGALTRGSQAMVRASLPGAEPAEPTLLVCTNGRRDVCCAVRGRPLAVHAGRVAPGRVWEVSHTGGHRFAPTAVLLPWGQTYARLDDSSAEWVLGASATGHTPEELLGPLHDRGRSALEPAAQCAESHVRALLGETRLSALWAGAPEARPGSAKDALPPDAWLVPVTHEDGRVWRLRVERAAAGLTRPESCGKKAVPVHEYRVTVVAGPSPAASISQP